MTIKMIPMALAFTLLLNACGKAEKPSTVPGDYFKATGPTDSKAQESDASTALYRALVAVVKLDQEVNYDLTKLFYVAPEIKIAFLTTLANRAQENDLFFRTNLQNYIQKCSTTKDGSEYKAVCSTKLYALTSTANYFNTAPAEIRPREVCDAFGELMSNLACEAANNLVWTQYKLNKAPHK